MQQIQEKLLIVTKCFPGTNFIVILNGSGEIVAQQNEKQVKVAEDLLAPIASLRKAAVQFTGTLNQNDCPLIHIRGANHLFSCYEFDDHLLAFYTEMQSQVMDVFNMTEADTKIKGIIGELKLLLQNLIS